MSDLHFDHAQDIMGLDPRVRLKAAIEHINSHHSDAEACVISGDMVNRGARSDYEGVKSILNTLHVPYLPMVGNHDDRELFREILPLPEACMEDFIQYQVETDDGLIVCLDTHKVGSDAGEICVARSAWLYEALKRATSTSVLIFMHHPPMSLGLPMQDTDQMQSGEAFLDLISEFPCVKYLFIGHVHRPITGTIRNIPFSTMRSVLYQAPPPRPEWSWETFKPSKEAPAIGVVRLENGSVNIQYDQFCGYEVGLTDRKDR